MKVQFFFVCDGIIVGCCSSLSFPFVLFNVGGMFDIGSVHDSRMLKLSGLWRELESHKGNESSGWLIGDSGYACRQFLLTPYNENEISEAYPLRFMNNFDQCCHCLLMPMTSKCNTKFLFYSYRYNDSLCMTRCHIESTYGMVKRFFCLRERLRVRPRFSTRIITTAVVLWNKGLDLSMLKLLKT